MIIKTTYRSHFKVRKFVKKSEKLFFVKNIIMFLLFSKFFITNCNINFFFFKKKKLKTNILKAPSRHKKFFHQIVNEIFFMKIFFYFFENLSCQNNKILLNTFNYLNNLFLKIGSNTLTRTKFIFCKKNQFISIDLI